MSKRNKNKQKQSVKPQEVEETKTPKEPKEKERPEVSITRLIDEYKEDFDALSTIHDEFSDKEKVLMGVKVDKITKGSTKSQIVDPTLQTAILKQNNETMAQLPTGKVETYLGDEGKSLLMNLLLDNHILPNANTQFDVYTKFWLLSLYRKVYGSFGVLVDYVQSDSYTGSDFTLIPVRSLVPQKGRYTVEACDHICVRSVVSKSWLLERDTKYWKNIDKLITDAPEAKADTDYQTYAEEKYSNESVAGTPSKKTEFELITRYEKDRWITFSKDAKVIVRDIDNPHDNGEIPIVVAHSYPLLDRFFGLGEFERGMTLHKAQSSLVNLYMDGVKMSIFPPLKLDPKNLVMETIKRDPGAMWFVKGGNMGAIDQVQISPQGLNTFNSTYGFLKGAMLALTNTTDTSISSDQDVGMGKTPQALKMQQMTQQMKTGFDRKMMDIAIEKIYNKMIDVMLARQEKPIKLKFMESEVARIKARYPDVAEVIGVDKGELVIKPTDIADSKYRFNIDAGSTVRKDEALENETLTSLLELIFKIPGAPEQIQASGTITVGNQTINFAEIIKQWIITSGIHDWDKIVEDAKEVGVKKGMLPPQKQMQPPMPQMPMGQPQMGMPPQMPMQPPMMPQVPQYQPSGNPEVDQIMQEIINGNRTA